MRMEMGCEQRAQEGEAQPATGVNPVSGAWKTAGRLRRGKAAERAEQYLFRSLLLFDPVADHDVDGFPAESLHYPLEAALLPCAHGGREKESALRTRRGMHPEPQVLILSPSGRLLRCALLSSTCDT